MSSLYGYDQQIVAYGCLLNTLVLFRDDNMTCVCFSNEGMAQYVNLFAEPGHPEYALPVKEAETRVCSSISWALCLNCVRRF